jgi:hypothetical protein
MKTSALGSMTLGGCILMACVGMPARSQELADIVLTNAKIFTASEAHPSAQAIAIRGARILAVGTNEKISALAGPKTRRIDAGGRRVIPGILDTHNHYGGALLPTVQQVDFGSGAPSCQQVLHIVARTAPKVPAGHLLFGFMGRGAFFDPQCTPAALDRVAPHTAVFLAGSTVHAGMLNRNAEKWFHVDTTAPPPLAGWYGKDTRSASWDGVVHNSAMLSLLVRTSSDGVLDDARLRRYFQTEERWGISWNTFLEYAPASRIEQLARVNSPHRVRVVPFSQYETGPVRRRLEQAAVPPAIADRVSSIGEKWTLDGTPVERSAPMRTPYADSPDTSGRFDYPCSEVQAILGEALQHGQPLMLHVTGDAMSQCLLDAMDATGGPEVWRKQRLRIEHGDGVIADLIPRAARLGAIVAQTPSHFNAPASKALLPVKSLVDAGVPFMIASDSGTGDEHANPFLNLLWTSTYPGNPAQAISREQALIAYTRTAAYSEFVDKDLGSLEPGKLADLAMLSQDILSVPDQALPKTVSVLTIIGGRIVYEKRPSRRGVTP